MRSWIREHSLSLVLITVFLAFTATTLAVGWTEYSSEQAAHGLPVDAPGFWTWWTFEYSMSLVADVFGMLLIVLLTKKLYERGSAESN